MNNVASADVTERAHVFAQLNEHSPIRIAPERHPSLEQHVRSRLWRQPKFVGRLVHLPVLLSQFCLVVWGEEDDDGGRLSKGSVQDGPDVGRRFSRHGDGLVPLYRLQSKRAEE